MRLPDGSGPGGSAGGRRLNSAEKPDVIRDRALGATLTVSGQTSASCSRLDPIDHSDRRNAVIEFAIVWNTVINEFPSAAMK